MITISLAALSIVLLCACVVLVIMWLDARKKGVRFSKVASLEDFSKALQNEINEQTLNVESYKKELAKLKHAYQTYSQVVGVMKTATDAQQKLESINKAIQDSNSVLGVVKDAKEATERFHALELENSNKLKATTDAYREALSQLLGAEQNLEVQSYGIHKRSFDYDVPANYIAKIDQTVARQKALVSSKQAAVCATEWTVEGSIEKGRKMAEEQIKLMLRAFNGECDAAIAKLKPNNFSSLQNRIVKAFEALNKLGSTKQIRITGEYLQCRVDELTLSHELELSREAERERQREIREQMREEEKAIKEIEGAKKKAEKDETVKAKALDEARRQLADEHGKHNEKLEALVAKLESELQDAIDRKAKAIARAQLTKSGHVYILSNIGTMGEGVYKIGMTRRLEPLERVKELGDASVPFPFDVHALIYSDNAPKLENALHRHFADRRLNLANNRKEYFNVTLDEIREAVKKNFGEFTFRVDHEAAQYRESIAIREQGLASEIPVAEDETDGEIVVAESAE